MEEIAIISRIQVLPGQRGDLVGVLGGRALTHEEQAPGARYVMLHEDHDDPDVLWMYEEYVTKDQLESRMGAEWFARLEPLLTPFIRSQVAGRSVFSWVERDSRWVALYGTDAELDLGLREYSGRP